MSCSYHLDPEQYTVKQFRENISGREMIPSRMILKEDLEKNFQILEDQGIRSLADLLAVLKTKRKRAEFSLQTGLPEHYLTILNREAKSYFPKPIRLEKFSGIPEQALENLQSRGITHTRHLFEAACQHRDRGRWAEELKISVEDLDRLICLSDLVRLYGFGPVFAEMILGVGICSVKEILELTPEEVLEMYERESAKKAVFPVQEIRFSLDLARALDLEGEI